MRTVREPKGVECKMRQAALIYCGGALAVKRDGRLCRWAEVEIPIAAVQLKEFCDSVRCRRENRQESDQPRFYGPEGSGIEIGYDDTSTQMGSCGVLSFFSHGAGLAIDVWSEDLDVLQGFVAGLGADDDRGLETAKGQRSEPQPVNEDSYDPNVTCPFCRDETMPTQEMEWTGWGLEVKQTCPECRKSWYENWGLESVDLHEEGK